MVSEFNKLAESICNKWGLDFHIADSANPILPSAPEIWYPDSGGPPMFIEIGAFGKLDYREGENRLTDTWMDNEGTVLCREIPLPDGDCAVVSIGNLVFQRLNGISLWFNSELIRRQMEELERGSSEAERPAHTRETGGSNPPPASNYCAKCAAKL